ncbi:hypothetical protein [Streptococcus sciuri]|uniref:DUF3951 domain-containing protein n=1 Tax=Streptococcus sciuri TaxID=2973939 RepID=A0ABT2F781_9STRE|nr:hypothetical protein [Streptococcus sciuri]MCS4488313.1 hypothetical protein [Streptococcus sciuri]
MNTVFYLFLVILLLFTIIKIALLVVYMRSIKPEVDADGNIIPKPIKNISEADQKEKEEEEYDRDW